MDFADWVNPLALLLICHGKRRAGSDEIKGIIL